MWLTNKTIFSPRPSGILQIPAGMPGHFVEMIISIFSCRRQSKLSLFVQWYRTDKQVESIDYKARASITMGQGDTSPTVVALSRISLVIWGVIVVTYRDFSSMRHLLDRFLTLEVDLVFMGRRCCWTRWTIPGPFNLINGVYGVY